MTGLPEVQVANNYIKTELWGKFCCHLSVKSLGVSSEKPQYTHRMSTSTLVRVSREICRGVSWSWLLYENLDFSQVMVGRGDAGLAPPPPHYITRFSFLKPQLAHRTIVYPRPDSYLTKAFTINPWSDPWQEQQANKQTINEITEV